MGQLCLAFVGIPAPVEHPCASRTGHAYAFSFGFTKEESMHCALYFVKLYF